MYSAGLGKPPSPVWILKQLLCKRGDDHILVSWQAEDFAIVRVAIQQQFNQFIKAIHNSVCTGIHILFEFRQPKDHAFMHIHDRSDANADRCFDMLTWNAIRYHRKRIYSSYGQLI